MNIEFKHYDLIMKIIANMHESWMDDENKKEFTTMMLNYHGKVIDDAIEDGIKKGYSVEKQEQLINKVFGK